MDKNSASIISSLSSILTLLLLISSATSDIVQDRDKCGDQLVGLATCLPYVSGDSKAPTMDCCTGLEKVLIKGKECLCILVKDRNDPNLGLKIDANLALGLPEKCHSHNADVSACPTLLHLKPNSTDAKVFEDFVKGDKADHGNVANSSSDRESPTTSAKSDGRRANWHGIDMVLGTMIIAAMLPLY